jgi:ACS family hexuronate transporter-like MFS transporter
LAALNYLDRQVLALLKPTLETEFSWTEIDYASFVEAFQWATIAALLLAGWLVGRFGVRMVYGAAAVLWSFAGMAHAFASTVSQFVHARFGLAAAEAINTPAAMKSVSTYLPLAERTPSVAVINTAPNIGAILAPLAIPPLALAFGWKSAFIVTGLLVFVWIAFWWIGTARITPQPAAAEALLQKKGADRSAVVKDKRTWTIVGAKFLTDFVWIFMLGWAPDFFKKTYNLTQAEIGWPVVIVYTLAALGALFSGGLFPWLLKRGTDYDRARKFSMFGFASVALIFPFALFAPDPWIAAVLVGIGLFAHQGFSTNVFALAADIFPPTRFGGAIALGAIAAQFSGILIARMTGQVLTGSGSYMPMFVMCGLAYFAGTLWVQFIQPKLIVPSLAS